MIQLTDEIRMVAYRDAREWAAAHRHPQPDDRMIDEVLTAALAVVERDYEPIRCDEPSVFGHRCGKPRGHDGVHQHRWTGAVWP